MLLSLKYKYGYFCVKALDPTLSKIALYLLLFFLYPLEHESYRGNVTLQLPLPLVTP